MKTLSVIITLLCLVTNCYCQVKSDSIVIPPSSQGCGMDLGSAHFPGGASEMMLFIDNNFHLTDSVPGRVKTSTIYLKITIDTTGTLTNISVLRGINQSIDNEFVRIFSIMPKWIPGIKDGKKIPAEFVLPIRYVVNDPEEKK
jgi:protein TonB